MINLTEILSAAANSPWVKRVAVGVTVVAVALYGVKLVFGSDVRVTTDDYSECSVSLADKTARLEMTEKALSTCVATVDSLTGVKP